MTLLITLSSCATYSNFLRTGDTYPELPEDTAVRVFSGQVPAGSIEIGMLSYKTSYMFNNMQKTRHKLIKRAKTEARKLGGDIVFLKRFKNKYDEETISYDMSAVFVIYRSKTTIDSGTRQKLKSEDTTE